MASLARAIFSKMPRAADEGGDDMGEEGESSPKLPDSGAVAGKRLAKALEGGDGAAIKSAFMAMMEECKGGDEEISDEPEGGAGDGY